jgi:phage terminase large subunit-like protein
VKFDKSAAQEKIDPMVALAMALGRAVLVDQETPPMEIVWI